jgi:hypothetical protein
VASTASRPVTIPEKSALKELKALKGVVSSSPRDLSLLFHEGGQIFSLIHLAILPSAWRVALLGARVDLSARESLRASPVESHICQNRADMGHPAAGGGDRAKALRTGLLLRV